MRQSILFLLCCFFQFIQSQNNYEFWKKKADSFYNLKDYIRAGNLYHNAFKTMENKGFKEDRIRYIHACAEIGELDSAFLVLNKIVFALGLFQKEELEDKKEYQKLKGDNRWNQLMIKVGEKRDSIQNKERGFNWHFVHELREMVKEDQQYRREKNWTKVEEVDKKHYFKLKAMYNRYGYLHYDIVGMEGSHNFWLLVQHQDLQSDFQDRVLTAMKIEVDRNKADKRDYAYLTDRVLLAKGKKQRYGTQMICEDKEASCRPSPLEDASNVNIRRKEMGLGPIENYILSMNKRYLK